MEINSQSSNKDLVQYLRDVHGVDMPNATKIELLNKASELDGIPYAEMNSPSASATSVEAQQIAQEGKRTIVIPSTEASDGQQAVFVGVNGVSFLIQRDVEAEVPAAVVEALRNAKQTVYRMIENELVPREILTYPFSIVR